jgi:hypothetical protein
MAFDARCFWHAKDLASVADYEDAFEVDPNVGRAAIADGVSTAIFSRRWAQLLTSSSVAAPPAWHDDAAVNAWILEQRKAWAKSINVQALPWMQKAKLEQSGGAYAAFLWAEIVPQGDSTANGANHPDATANTSSKTAADEFHCRSVAVGDCCLFHVRAGELLARFPLSSEADFARDPLTFCSSSRNRQPQPPLQRCEFSCQSGDWVVLSSDALAKWLYRLSDQGQPIDWAALWQQDAYAWTQRVGSLRMLNADDRVRVDDTTLLILRVGQSPASTVVEASESATPTLIDDQIIVAELADPDEPSTSAPENTSASAPEATSETMPETVAGEAPVEADEREMHLVEPAASEPAASEPAASEPAASENAASENAAHEPASDAVTLDEPRLCESARIEAKVVGSDPVGSDPVGSDPVGSDSNGSDPVGSDPVGSDSNGSDPSSGERSDSERSSGVHASHDSAPCDAPNSEARDGAAHIPSVDAASPTVASSSDSGAASERAGAGSSETV